MGEASTIREKLLRAIPVEELWWDHLLKRAMRDWDMPYEEAFDLSMTIAQRHFVIQMLRGRHYALFLDGRDIPDAKEQWNAALDEVMGLPLKGTNQ